MRVIAEDGGGFYIGIATEKPKLDVGCEECRRPALTGRAHLCFGSKVTIPGLEP